MSDHAPFPGFSCTSCGKCCTDGANKLPATETDIAMWEAHAPHLLAYVKLHSATSPRAGDLWINPKTGKANATTRCPWIRKRRNQDHYDCRIYDHRPAVCRRYPTSHTHAILTDCPGVTPGPLNDNE